jgi:glycosyltransferase involved in cell wall biosynthesis
MLEFGTATTKTLERRIGIVYPTGFLSVTPSLVGLVQSLTNHGYAVDLYLCFEPDIVEKAFSGKNVQVYILPQMNAHSGRIKLWLSGIRYLRKQYQRFQYTALIGVDAWGLLLASIPAKMDKVPVVYLSLEMLFLKNASSVFLKILKLLERICNKWVDFSIIQDLDRANLLSVENNIPLDKIQLLPNAPLGPASVHKTNYLHEILLIDSERTIILHLGNIHSSLLSEELARNAGTWQSNLAMVFHSKSQLSPSADKYIEKFISQVDGSQVYLSDQPVLPDQIRELVSSAQIGVALYDHMSSDFNSYTVGMSSGKIAHYLQCGLPVIVSNLPTLKRLIDTYDCGICVEKVEEVPAAVETILSDYATYSKNAIICFQKEFDFNLHVAPILARLDKNHYRTRSESTIGHVNI